MPTAKPAIQMRGKMSHYPTGPAEDGLINFFNLRPTHLPSPAGTTTNETFCV